VTVSKANTCLRILRHTKVVRVLLHLMCTPEKMSLPAMKTRMTVSKAVVLRGLAARKMVWAANPGVSAYLHQ